MAKELATRSAADWREILTEDSLATKIRGVLPAHLTAERMAQLVLGEMARNPKIADCTTESVALAYLTCGQLGLEPSSPLGHVYLVPYGKTLTVIIGYKGLLQLARNGGILWAHAEVVYEDEVKAGTWEGSIMPPAIHHSWAADTDRSDAKIAAAYCVVRTKDDAQYQVILTRAEIDARRKRSKASGSGPWVTDFAAMARKCAVRALLSGGMVPLSAEVAEGLRNDHDGPEWTAPRIVETTAEPSEALDRMVGQVAARADQ